MGVCLFVLCLVATSGCAPEQRYRVLSFFFDGVPSPGEEVTAPTDGGAAQVAAAAQPRERRQRPQVPRVYTHGPYASKNCTACHVTGAAATATYIPGRGRRGSVPAFGIRLRLPKQALCSYCHAEFRPERLAETYRFTHGPVAAGACLRCHNPHTSPNPYMVRKAPIAGLCLECHRPTDIFRSDSHAGEGLPDCVVCHHPHGGDDPYFLRADRPASNHKEEPAADPDPMATDSPPGERG